METQKTELQILVDGMNSSVASINAALADKKTDNTVMQVRVNVLHLEHSLASALLKDGKTDIKPFTKAVADGKKFLS